MSSTHKGGIKRRTKLDRRLDLVPFHPSRRWRGMTAKQRAKYVQVTVARLEALARDALDVSSLTDKELAARVCAEPDRFDDAAKLMHVAAVHASSLRMMLDRERQRIANVSLRGA